MTNKTTKSALLTSCISLLLCFTMLLGTTFAWFTDTVTSANNIIKSGNLDIKLEYLADNGEWKSVQGASDILTNKLWEPGVTEVAYLKLTNAGSLALKYQFGINIVSEILGKNVSGNDLKLSEYLMFGVKESATFAKYENRADAVADITAPQKISAGYTSVNEAATGMEPGVERYIALVVYMPETVGNEANHDGANVPKIALGINVAATQVANEEDSFDANYDATTSVPVLVSNPEELTAALAAGETVALAADIALGATDQVNVSGGILDGNGKTLDATASQIDGMECALNTRGGVIKDLTIIGPNARALGSGSNNVVTFVDDLYIDNVTIDNTYYALNGSINSNHSVYVTNSKINGWISYAGLDLLSFKNTTLAKGHTTCTYGIGYLVVYGDTLIENCTFEEFYMGVNTSALNSYVKPAKDAGTPYTLTINNSYYKTGSGSVKITADNFKTYLTDGNDAKDFGRLLDNVDIYVDGVRVQ